MNHEKALEILIQLIIENADVLKRLKEEERKKMSLRKETPCDFGPCTYNANYSYNCECWCEADESEDYPEKEED